MSEAVLEDAVEQTSDATNVIDPAPEPAPTTEPDPDTVQAYERKKFVDLVEAALMIREMKGIPNVKAVKLETVEEIEQFATHYATLVGGPEVAFALTCYSMALGIDPGIGLLTMKGIKGQTGISVIMLASVQRTLLTRIGIRWEKIEHTRDVCHYNVFQGDRLLGDVRITMQDAKDSHMCYIEKVDNMGNPIMKLNWQYYPEDMLYARMISRIGKRFAEAAPAFGGLAVYDPDEINRVADFVPAGKQVVDGQKPPATNNTRTNGNGKAPGKKVATVDYSWPAVCRRILAKSKSDEDVRIFKEMWEKALDALVLRGLGIDKWADKDSRPLRPQFGPTIDAINEMIATAASWDKTTPIRYLHLAAPESFDVDLPKVLNVPGVDSIKAVIQLLLGGFDDAEGTWMDQPVETAREKIVAALKELKDEVNQ